MLWEISEGRRVKPPSEIYRPGDFLPYTLRGISRKCALLLGQCSVIIRHCLVKRGMDRRMDEGMDRRDG
jgi:hypothetical protein